MHSNGFFNSRLVIPDEELLSQAASDLLDLYTTESGSYEMTRVEGIVGPQTGATKLAELLKEQVQKIAHSSCFFVSPAKGEKDSKKVMIFSKEERHLVQKHSLLPCEDVITTGGSVDLTTDAVTHAGGIVLPYILTLVNRSGFTKVNGKKIIALINHHMPTWIADDCPLCAQGSEAIRPKGPEEWTRLNASY
jgi:orotate phosphoribosyltransferase